MNKIYGKQHIGMTNKNSFGTDMKIIDYINGRNVLIEFQDKYKCRKYVDMSNFKCGRVSNPYDKTILGVAFIGDGSYSKENDNECYKCWRNMLGRCFDRKYQEKYPTYKNTHIDEAWLNFQNFADWYYENIYHIPGERMELDKDILYKNNKLYSPETCIFVPRRINSLLINNKNKRGEFPVGVDYYRGKFRARCNTLGTSVFIGDYSNPYEAFLAYKKYKENYIKKIANEYKDKIPSKLYDALYSFIVEEGD